MREAAGCPECGSYVSEEGVTSGPEAPELGWDYYECPSCQARMSLNTANLDGPG
jgi:transcription initiation factor IIE alpha subunit